ncbi:MAG: chemotaxis protein CheW [Anaerolineae bacterium]|nr:chemotaxis protein CheW [Anaerolineae bacterium]MDW8099020.1 chemotaxis protein CheW [Anaerolineae bacterium]
MAAETATRIQEEQLVVFRLGDESYGIDISRVQGIERMQPVTIVPRAPHWIEGVINLRGQITPVMNLRVRFGFERVEPTKETRIVVVQIKDQRVGLVVDKVTGVLRINGEQVEPPSELVASMESAYLRGIAKLEDGLLILLDLDKVLNGHEAEKLLQAV